MGRPLRALIVEDSVADTELLLRALRREGYDVSHRRVDTAADMRSALAQQPWDIVLSDYAMPSFSVASALAILHESGLDIPFIVLSGSVGEENAVGVMKAGAHDFFLKDRLTRFGSAIDRELREAEVRRERRIARDRLEESERQLRRAVQARDEFLMIASHELKTPLTSLELLVAKLRRVAESNPGIPISDHDFQSKCGSIARQVDRMTVLINNLLDVARITSGSLELSRERIDLPELVRDILERTRDAIRRSGSEIALEVTAPVVGTWDRLRLETIVANLVSNAIKFGEGKPIEITIGRSGEQATLTVRDHGIGISEENQGRIFGRFERAVSVRHFGGFGIGLWVVRQSVEAHGGRIQVKSRQGGGSGFTVELPLQAQDATSAARAG
jgi:signal transduction histidine kinase